MRILCGGPPGTLTIGSPMPAAEVLLMLLENLLLLLICYLCMFVKMLVPALRGVEGETWP